jgi:hypothetical protein
MLDPAAFVPVATAKLPPVTTLAFPNVAVDVNELLIYFWRSWFLVGSE